jgi:L-arabinokinase
MWQIAAEPAGLSDEVRQGLRYALTTINQQGGFFDPRREITLARAPGRLDLMGGIADYSGALVLQLPLAVATWVAAQAVDAPTICIRSQSAAAIGAAPEVELPLDRLLPPDHALSYAEARAALAADARQGWAAYVAGVLVVLRREEGMRFAHGLRLLITSEVPVGKGVSSSAALEVATMQAICGLLGLRLPGRRVALLCQLVENMVVGAPCGVMDQMTAACGEQNTLLALLCQPAELQPGIVLPNELAVWGIDSGVRHAVAGGDYGSVRIGAFMGYRMIAERAGLPVERAAAGRVQVTDARWHGYLCNIAPSEWESDYRDHLPETIEGAAFLARYGGFTDPVTTIAPDRPYPVRRPTAHPIYEHHRVRLFRALLTGAPLDQERLRLLGELMYQSHASYSACGLGAAGTDRLVALVREAGPAAGLYGAKITGGGSGGMVAVLGRPDARPAVAAIARRYGAEIAQEIMVLGGSSPGAVRFGLVPVRSAPGA